MLITEELYLLETQASGKQEPAAGYSRSYGLAGARLTDLILAGKIGLTNEKCPRVQLVDTTPTGNPVLDFG